MYDYINFIILSFKYYHKNVTLRHILKPFHGPMKSCSVACIDILVLHDHILNCTIHSIVAIVAVVGCTIITLKLSWGIEEESKYHKYLDKSLKQCSNLRT